MNPTIRLTFLQLRGRLLRGLLLPGLLLAGPGAAGAAPDPWGLEFHGDGRSLRTMALDTDIVADVTGTIARIDVRQRFRNTGGAWSEASYPLAGGRGRRPAEGRGRRPGHRGRDP